MQENKIEEIQIGKEEFKLFLFRENMIVFYHKTFKHEQQFQQSVGTQNQLTKSKTSYTHTANTLRERLWI